MLPSGFARPRCESENPSRWRRWPGYRRSSRARNGPFSTSLRRTGRSPSISNEQPRVEPIVARRARPRAARATTAALLPEGAIEIAASVGARTRFSESGSGARVARRAAASGTAGADATDGERLVARPPRFSLRMAAPIEQRVAAPETASTKRPADLQQTERRKIPGGKCLPIAHLESDAAVRSMNPSSRPISIDPIDTPAGPKLTYHSSTWPMPTLVPSATSIPVNRVTPAAAGDDRLVGPQSARDRRQGRLPERGPPGKILRRGQIQHGGSDEAVLVQPIVDPFEVFDWPQVEQLEVSERVRHLVQPHLGPFSDPIPLRGSACGRACRSRTPKARDSSPPGRRRAPSIAAGTCSQEREHGQHRREAVAQKSWVMIVDERQKGADAIHRQIDDFGLWMDQHSIANATSSRFAATETMAPTVGTVCTNGSAMYAPTPAAMKSASAGDRRALRARLPRSPQVGSAIREAGTGAGRSRAQTREPPARSPEARRAAAAWDGDTTGAHKSRRRASG